MTTQHRACNGQPFQIPALPLPSCVTLSRSFYLPEPQFPPSAHPTHSADPYCTISPTLTCCCLVTFLSRLLAPRFILSRRTEHTHKDRSLFTNQYTPSQGPAEAECAARLRIINFHVQDHKPLPTPLTCHQLVLVSLQPLYSLEQRHRQKQAYIP